MRNRLRSNLVAAVFVAVSLAACVSTQRSEGAFVDDAGITTRVETTSIQDPQASAGDRTAGQAVDDATITARVKTALMGNADTDAVQINVSTREGIVRLIGFVSDADEKHIAENLAIDVVGVRRVDNELELRLLTP